MTYASRVSCCFQEGRTPLHAAAKSSRVGAKKVVELLVAAGANIKARDKVGWDACVNKHWYVAPWYVPPPHTLLSWCGKATCLSLRPLSAGVHPNNRTLAIYVPFGPRDDLQKSNTVLHIAAAEWDSTALRPLLKQPGVQLDARNAVGGVGARVLCM